MDACPKCTHPHVVKAGKVQGPTALVMSGLWRSVYALHAAWETAVATVAGRLSLLSRRLDERLGEDVRGVASTILTWIRRYAADHAAKPTPNGKAIIMEIDEMWHFLKKNGAHSGSGRLWIVIQAASLTGSAGVVRRQP